MQSAPAASVLTLERLAAAEAAAEAGAAQVAALRQRTADLERQLREASAASTSAPSTKPSWGDDRRLVR